MPPEDLDRSRLPTHVGVVMDGNGRWAERRGLPRSAGHDEIVTALFDTVHGALEVGVQWLTVYLFSTENWRRPADELKYLVGLRMAPIELRTLELHELGVRVRVIGRRDWRVPKRFIRQMDHATSLTRDNRRMTLTLAFNYGGRTEIVDAVRSIVRSGIPERNIDERALREHLYDPEMPDPDLVVRTAGEYRISNFLLWGLAYSELVFTDVLWPDFRREHLFAAIREFQTRDRRYGGLAPRARR